MKQNEFISEKMVSEGIMDNLASFAKGATGYSRPKGDLLVTSDLPGHGISVGFRSDYSSNAVFAKSLVDDKAHTPRVIWAVIL